MLATLYNYIGVVIATSCLIEGQEYTECGTACPIACRNPNPAPCAPDCVPGCQCPLGTVLDEENNKCVEHCPIPPLERGMVTYVTIWEKGCLFLSRAMILIKEL